MAKRGVADVGSREPTEDVRTPDEILADQMILLRGDPLGYVMFCFPWDTEPSIQVVPFAAGVEDQLTPQDKKRQAAYRARFPNCAFGPDLWACDFLEELGREIKNRAFDGSKAVAPIRFVTVSGHEIGKSALCGWLTKFILDTRPFSKGTMTAVTDEQLRTKTWGELGKWHHMSLTSHWFEYRSARGAMTLAHVDSKYSGSWRCDARTCREEKSEAFAGQHAPTATSFYIFDEGSGVPNKVYEVREGGLSSGEPMVFDFGNGTRNSGEFYENCEGKESGRYIVRSIDSRSVRITNKEKIAEDEELWGSDSDRFRVRWRGLFPTRGQAQFISTELVKTGMARALPRGMNRHQLVFGVDVGRSEQGDASVIYPRQGNDARSHPVKRWTGLDAVQLSDEVGRLFAHYEGLGLRPAAIFIDRGGGGGGSGVADILINRGYPVIGVDFGGSPTNDREYRFKADEMWGRVRNALMIGELCLPELDTDIGVVLYDDLTQREYGLTLNGQKMNLESKKEMRKRGLQSPDVGDGLCLTYAFDIPTLEDPNSLEGAMPMQTEHDNDPFDALDNEE